MAEMTSRLAGKLSVHIDAGRMTVTIAWAGNVGGITMSLDEARDLEPEFRDAILTLLNIKYGLVPEPKET